MGEHDLLFCDMVHRNAVKHRHRTAFSSEATQWTFEEYARDSERVAAGLAGLGVIKGDRIAVFAYNSYEYFLIYAAAARLGAIVVPVNWRLTDDEVFVLFEDSTPGVIFSCDPFCESLGKVADRCGSVRHRFVIGGESRGYTPFAVLFMSASPPPATEVSQNDPFVIIHTAAV